VVSRHSVAADPTTLLSILSAPPFGFFSYRLRSAAILLLLLWLPRPREAGREAAAAVLRRSPLAEMNFCFY